MIPAKENLIQFLIFNLIFAIRSYEKSVIYWK